MELHGESANQASLFAWNTDQGVDNYGELSENHDPTTADYAGASPMVGFGAGAYLIALADRGTPVTPTCGAFASEPALVVGADGGIVGEGDGGPAGEDGGVPIVLSDGGLPSGSGDDGGAGGASGTGSASGKSGCACDAVGSPRSSGSLLLLASAIGLLGAARKRAKRGST